YVRVCDRHHVRNLTAKIHEHARHRSAPMFSEKPYLALYPGTILSEEITKAAATAVKVRANERSPAPHPCSSTRLHLKQGVLGEASCRLKASPTCSRIGVCPLTSRVSPIG